MDAETSEQYMKVWTSSVVRTAIKAYVLAANTHDHGASAKTALAPGDAAARAVLAATAAASVRRRGPKL